MATNKKIAGITVEISGDTTKLGKALDGVDKQSRDIKNELKQLDKALKLDPKNTELLAQKQQVLAEAITNSRKKLDTLKEAEKQIEQQFKNGEIDNGQYRAFKREVENAKGELKYYEDEAEKAKDKTSKLNKAVSDTKDDFKSAGKAIEDAGQSVSSFGDKITEAGEKATIASGIIVGAAAASYKAWEDVDEGYDNIIKKTGATGDALDSLTNIADKVFTSMPTDMATVSTAVGEINTRFGATDDELERLTRAFIKYSEITGSDVNNSIDNISASMKAFGIESKDAVTVLDKIASVSQKTGISTSQLESNLLSQSAVFKEMGLSIADTAELLGQFELNGVDTSTAIASLRKAQQNAAKSGKTLSEELRKDFYAIELAKDETEALQLATELFGKKGAAAMSQAIREDRIELNNLSTTAEDVAGTVDRTFEATLDAPDRLKVSINQVKLSASNLAATVLDRLEPALDRITSKIKTLTDSFNNLSDSEKDVILKVAGIIAAVGPVTIASGKVVSAIGSIISTFGSLVTLITANPASLVVAGIVAILAALVLLYAKSEDFRQLCNELFDDIREDLSDTVNQVKQTFDDIGNTLSDWWAETEPYHKYIREALEILVQILVNKLMSAIRGAVDGFTILWSAVKLTFGNILSFITTVLLTIKRLFKAVTSALTGDFSGAWAEIKGIFSDWGSFFEGLVNRLYYFFYNILSRIINIFADTWDNIKILFSGFVSSFSEPAEEFINTLKSIPQALVDGFEEAFEKIIGWIDNIIDKIGEIKLPSVTSGAKSLLSKLNPINWFGSGGTLSRNGETAIVGEAGPELLRFLNGKAVVTPLNGATNTTITGNADTSAPRRTNIYQTYNINVKSFSSPQDARTTSEQLAQLQRQTDYGKGLVTT